MANSNATTTRNVIVDLPDFPAGVVTFSLKTYFAAEATEGFPQNEYSLTLDGSGTGTQALAVPSTGAWLYEVGLPDGNNPLATLAAGADIQLTAWLAAALSTETANELTDSFVLKGGDTMTGPLTLSGAPTADLHAATKKYVDDNAQPLDAGLTDLAGLPVTDGNFIVGDGANWVAESGATARASLGATVEEIGAANVYNVMASAYGAIGDGVADDTAAILAAIAAAKAAGGGTVFLPEGTYLISKSLIMPTGVELRGAGLKSKITKAATVKSLLTANANAGAFTVTVTDSTGFTVGGAIHIYDTSSVEWLSTQAVITDITGNVITFDDAIDGNLQTARSASATTSFPLIRNEVASTDVVIRDLTLDQNANASDPADDFTLSIIHWVETYRSLVENCTLINACGDAYSDQAQDGTGITPAANLIKTTKNTIKGCKIRSAARHGVHLGTCMRGGWVLDNDIVDCLGKGFFYCAYVTETVAANNRMENCGAGFSGIDERDYDNIIIGNTVKNTNSLSYALDAISTTGAGGRLIIANNIFITDETVGAGTKTGRVMFNVPDSIFQGNIINMAAKTGEALRIGANSARCVVSDNRLISSSGAGGTTGVQIDAVSDLRFSNNLIGTFSNCVSLRGATRMIADGNYLAPTNKAWALEVATSTDCVIKNERTIYATPVTETVAATRLIYEGIGTNGASDPASAGDWNAASGRRFDGTLVRWNSGGGEKISIFYNGVGWTVLN